VAIMTNGILGRPERLEAALNAPVVGREREWVRDLADALTDLERALLRHSVDTAVPSGVFAEVDTTRRGLVTQIGALREKLLTLLDQTVKLTNQAQQTAQVEDEADPNFGALGSRAAEILGGVRELLNGEVDVVMESVNMDLGAGD
jgi:hypothetical protein